MSKQNNNRAMEDAFVLFVIDHLSQVKTQLQQHSEHPPTQVQIQKALRNLWNQASEQFRTEYLNSVSEQPHDPITSFGPFISMDNKNHALCETNSSPMQQQVNQDMHHLHTKKRKLNDMKQLTYFNVDILKEILFFLDAPDFINSRPWLVCKQWNQIFFKKDSNFAKLYYHSYFKLNQDQQQSLQQMLNHVELSFLDALILSFPYERVMISEKVPKFAKLRSKQNQTITILKENLFRHVIILNQHSEKVKGKDSTMCSSTSEYIAFLSNGYPMHVEVVVKNEHVHVSFDEYNVTTYFDHITIHLEGYQVFTIISYDQLLPVLVRDDVSRDCFEAEGLKYVAKFLELEIQERLTFKQFATIVLYWLKQLIRLELPHSIDYEYGVKFGETNHIIDDDHSDQDSTEETEDHDAPYTRQ
ncbi:hypothetical protein C9374_003508 [Naegleria lovaniensis]|uniref:F-box domain-containing protein n=1 Tax=Naegleria lovaniensis TaxID=51637 RepID=A0AA88GTE9_NAELO|nr:uncharacterized protein C9374_003508 [Naegleria lovaniensis]KAG2385693.1 hypothetical protein C9374_003508 [Naegleria lovaniensis]